MDRLKKLIENLKHITIDPSINAHEKCYHIDQLMNSSVEFAYIDSSISKEVINPEVVKTLHKKSFARKFADSIIERNLMEIEDINPEKYKYSYIPSEWHFYESKQRAKIWVLK